MRDVSCVRRRARQINRARGSGEEDRHFVGKEILPKFLLLLLLRHPGGSPVLNDRGPAPFSYTCPNYQLFLGKSSGFVNDSENRVRSRTRVQTFVFLILPSWIYQAWPP